MAAFLLLCAALLAASTALPGPRHKRSVNDCIADIRHISTAFTFNDCQRVNVTSGPGPYSNYANYNKAVLEIDQNHVGYYLNVKYDIDIESSGSCGYDKLTIGGGGVTEQVQICGTRRGTYSVKLDNPGTLRVGFTSDSSVVQRGFNMTFTYYYLPVYTETLPRYNIQTVSTTAGYGSTTGYYYPTSGNDYNQYTTSGNDYNQYTTSGNDYNQYTTSGNDYNQYSTSGNNYYSNPSNYYTTNAGNNYQTTSGGNYYTSPNNYYTSPNSYYISPNNYYTSPNNYYTTRGYNSYSTSGNNQYSTNPINNDYTSDYYGWYSTAPSYETTTSSSCSFTAVTNCQTILQQVSTSNYDQSCQTLRTYNGCIREACGSMLSSMESLMQSMSQLANLFNCEDLMDPRGTYTGPSTAQPFTSLYSMLTTATYPQYSTTRSSSIDLNSLNTDYLVNTLVSFRTELQEQQHSGTEVLTLLNQVITALTSSQYQAAGK